jgi:serine/threonine protein kinase
MTPEQIERVFGRGRLKMATGEHVEVFREAVVPGERRRYTKRFLDTTDGHFAHWTEREWRILARLIGHGIDCVPDVVQFDRGLIAGRQLVQTYDAGVTVDQWATLLPLIRDGRIYRHVFEDCAHWWALAHHSLIALKKIHQLQLVHLDVKGDNICIPLGPATFDCDAPDERLYPNFDQLALIDFAFALVSGEALTQPLPIGWQREYDYQSPRLLRALDEGRNGDLQLTRQLDWRCDMYSLAAMLKRYLPDEAAVHQSAATGWTTERYDTAKSLIFTLREHHDRDVSQAHPHAALINATGAPLREKDLASSLAFGWVLARDIDIVPASASPLTPMTRLAPSIRVFVSPHERMSNDAQITALVTRDKVVPLIVPPRDDSVRFPTARRSRVSPAALATAALVIVALVAFAAPTSFPDLSRSIVARMQTWGTAMWPYNVSTASSADAAKSTTEGAVSSTTPPQVADAAPVSSAPQTSAVTEPLRAKPEAAEPNRTSPVSDSPLPADTRTQPVATNEKLSDAIGSSGSRLRVAATPAPLVASTPRKTLDAHKGATKNDKKGKATPAPSWFEQSSKATKYSKGAQRPFPVSSANRIASSTHRGLTTSSAAKPGSVQTQALAMAESRPTPTQVALAAPLVAHDAPSPPSSSLPPLLTLSSAPSNAETEQSSPRQIADTPTPLPPSPTRERARSSRVERTADTGWLSQLLQLVGKKAAPIEDRRLQAAAPKKPMTAMPQMPSSVRQLALADPQPSIVPPKAAIGSSPPHDATPASTQPIARDDSRAPQIQEIPDARVQSQSIERDRDDFFASEARRALSQVVPRIAAQTQIEVARVLWVAANANDPTQDRVVINATQSIWVRDDGASLSRDISPAEARRLNDQARDAYRSRRNITEAFDLQLKAFGANPYDGEIAGNLALMHLKHNRLQPETARQLALFALAYRGALSRTGRFEDWVTYAIASALTGREADARNALFVTVALSRNIERSCRYALGALSNYGEPLRGPVEAMFNRIHMQGRGYETPYCSWPPQWAADARLQ